MTSRSAEMEAREMERDLARTPRAQEVNDRIQALLQALPFPSPDGPTAKRREELEGYALSLSYTFAWGTDISQEEHDEWMGRLA